LSRPTELSSEAPPLPFGDLWRREINPRELEILIMLKTLLYVAPFKEFLYFNFALVIPFNLFYKNPGEMQNKNKRSD